MQQILEDDLKQQLLDELFRLSTLAALRGGFV
jgi:hypothetical protein